MVSVAASGLVGCAGAVDSHAFLPMMRSATACYQMEGDLLKSVVHQRVAFQRCADGQTIYELKDEKAQREITNLTKEIIKLMEAD